MEFLQMVKDKQPVYDVIFEPLQAIIDVLNIYEVEIPEKSLLQLQELPERQVTDFTMKIQMDAGGQQQSD